MDDLSSKLQVAEMNKAKWLIVADIPFDQLPGQLAELKVIYSFYFIDLLLSNYIIYFMF